MNIIAVYDGTFRLLELREIVETRIAYRAWRGMARSFDKRGQNVPSETLDAIPRETAHMHWFRTQPAWPNGLALIDRRDAA